jgi:alcohol dehydrogenase, propanol-preferring
VLAEKLGAHHYIDSSAVDPAKALQELGGAVAIVATAASGASMSPLLAGLAPRGQLVVVGVGDDPIEVNASDLVFDSARSSAASPARRVKTRRACSSAPHTESHP